MLYEILTTFILFVSSHVSFSQVTQAELDEYIKNASEKELVTKNFESLNAGNYFYALQVSEKLLSYQPESANYNYRHGFALLNSQSDFTKPQPYLEKAGSNIEKNFDAFSTKEKGAPVDAISHLVRCLHLDEQLSLAKAKYIEFIDRAQKGSELIALANLALSHIEVANEIIKLPKNYELKNLTEVINHDGPDYSAVVSLDGTVLYFTSRRLRADSSNYKIENREFNTNQYLEDIYVSFTDFDGEWDEPVMLEFCEADKKGATVAVSADERRVYIFKDTEGNGDIFYSDFSSNRFQKVKHVDNSNINTDAWEPHITVTPDGQQMYFSSNREGGFGGRDIYRMVKLPNGEWSEPMKLGPEINGPWDKDSPFIAVNNKTLYFASNGEKSMGGFDIFISVRDENNNWSNPINLGTPLNSTGDDLYYTTTMDGLTGYLTSFRKDGIGEKDIYEIKNDCLGLENIAVLKGEIETINGDLPEDIAVTVRCLNCGDSYDKTVFPRLLDGVFFSSLEPCRDYELIFHYNDGKTEFHRETVSTDCDLKYDEIYRHLLLDIPKMTAVKEKDKISKYCPIAFKHYFGYNKNLLETNSGELKSFLDTIEAQFNSGRTSVELNIASSTSSVPTRTFLNNEELAQFRATKLKNVLVNYFATKPYKDSVEIIIQSFSVNGPKYKYGTSDRLDLYGPYQFVALQSTAYNCLEEAPLLNSKDKELVGKIELEKNLTVITSTDGVEAFSEKAIDAETAVNQAARETFLSIPYTYNIVTGAFRRADYAEGMVAQLKARGFKNAAIIGKKTHFGLFRQGVKTHFQMLKNYF